MHQNNIAEQRRQEREAAQVLVGCTLNERYQLDALLGQGGFAVVYRATDLRMDTQVAVKLAKPGASDIAPRFHNEVTLSARLSPDRCIARATDRGVLATAGRFDGSPYLVTDLIPGQELSASLLRSPRFPLPATIRIARDLLHALVLLHKRGIVHRDIKPANVMVRDDGSAVLIDLGLAFATGAGDEPRSPDLTAARQVVGTKLYMSPEQGLGFRPSCSFDLYALGVTLYQALTGSPPFRAIPDKLILQHKLNNKIPPVSRLRPDSPPALSSAIMSMLAVAPEDRPSAADVLKQLKSLDTGALPAATNIAQPLAPLSEQPSEHSSAPETDAPNPEATPTSKSLPPAPACVVLPLDPISSPRRRGEASRIEGWDDEPVVDAASSDATTDSAHASKPRLRLALPLLTIVAAVLITWLVAPGTHAPIELHPVLGSFPAPSQPTRELPNAPHVPSPAPGLPELGPEPTTPLPAASTIEPPHPRPRLKKKKPPSAPRAAPLLPEPGPLDKCAESRVKARKAAKSKNWKAVLSATKDPSCWASKAERAQLRANAFFYQGRYPACYRESLGHPEPELKRLNDACFKSGLQK